MARPMVPRRASIDTGFTSSSACGYGNPRSSTAFTVLKMAVFAPMPSASTSNATVANPRLLFKVRKAKRTSWAIVMLDLACQSGEHARGDNLRPPQSPCHWPRRSFWAAAVAPHPGGGSWRVGSLTRGSAGGNSHTAVQAGSDCIGSKGHPMDGVVHVGRARKGCCQSALAPVMHGDRAAAERLRRD